MSQYSPFFLSETKLIKTTNDHDISNTNTVDIRNINIENIIENLILPEELMLIALLNRFEQRIMNIN